MRPLILRPAAEAEIEEAYRWYEGQRPGLGDEFARAVDACLASIRHRPEFYSEQFQRARRALLRRFPYAIFYLIQDNSIDVIACFHMRRDPRRWRARL